VTDVNRFVFRTLGQAKRLIIIVIGFTILAVGIAMIVFPGPAVVVIPVGLAILATEFIWAKKLLATLTEHIDRMRSRRGSNR
jgi:tellurite resistance protein TerC